MAIRFVYTGYWAHLSKFQNHPLSSCSRQVETEQQQQKVWIRQQHGVRGMSTLTTHVGLWHSEVLRPRLTEFQDCWSFSSRINSLDLGGYLHATHTPESTKNSGCCRDFWRRLGKLAKALWEECHHGLVMSACVMIQHPDLSVQL